jgi:hypothetical protein
MSSNAIATTGDVFGALAVLLTIGYPAFQISQNTAQQKREETVSIQRGQKRSCSQLNEHQMVRRYAMTAEQGRPAGSREGPQLDGFAPERSHLVRLGQPLTLSEICHEATYLIEQKSSTIAKTF